MLVTASSEASLGQLVLQLLLMMALIGVWSLRCQTNGTGTVTFGPVPVAAELIPLTSVLPKLESLHEEVKQLLIKNAELNSKILVALQAQNEAKIRQVQAAKLLATPIEINQNKTVNATKTTNSNKITKLPVESVKTKPQQQQTPDNGRNVTKTSPSMPGKQTSSLLIMKQKSRPDDPAHKSMIDFNELEDFNKWVEINLEYAVKNTQASAEALREEAQQNNGFVDYSQQALKDGVEGVKYWQSAVMFQDKTLKNEKFESIDV